MVCGIYYIKNVLTNQYYVGQSINIKRRWNQHISLLNKNQHYNVFLQKHWNQYGSDNFTFSIIKSCKEKYLNRFEKLYIKIYNAFDSGYNYTIGGDFNPMMSIEVRNKVSKSTTGDKNHFYGKKHSLLSEIIMSQKHNTSGYFRVSKEYGKYKNGYRWRYQYYDDDNKKRAIKSVNIDKLKNKVINLGLPWIKFSP